MLSVLSELSTSCEWSGQGALFCVTLLYAQHCVAYCPGQDLAFSCGVPFHLMNWLPCRETLLCLGDSEEDAAVFLL